MSIIDSLRRVSTVASLLALSFSAAHAGSIVYVSNFGSNTVTSYDADTGAFLGTPVTAGAEASGFNGLRVNADGSIVIASQFSNNVVKYSNGSPSVFDPTNTAGLNSGQGITYGPDGKLYVVSSANDQILKYDAATGNFLGVFADLGSSGHVGPIDLEFGPDGNLYVTGFDSDVVVKVDGTTGSVLASTQGPDGLGFGPVAFGPDGKLYLAWLDLTTFEGGIYQFDLPGSTFTPFIAPGDGGLSSPGGIAFAGNKLLVANLLFDENFNDTGSTILRFNGQTGAFEDTLVTAGNGLNTPFFMTVVTPEPSSLVLVVLGAILIGFRVYPKRAA